MIPWAEEYLAELSVVHAGVERALEGLPGDAVNWVPGPEMNSMAVLATHATGSQRFWIGEIVGGEPVARVREEEFRATAPDGAALIARLHEIAEHSRGVVERLTAEDLDRRVETPADGTRAASWALLHALAHTSEHMAHLQMTRQLWDARGG